MGAAFHSPIVAPAADRFAEFLAGVPIGKPSIPVYSNTTGERYADSADIAKVLAAQIANPVEFVAEIENMYADGARVFLTLGPRSSHATMIDKILGDRPHLAISIDDQSGGLKGLLKALGALAVQGAAIDLSPLYAGRDCASVPLTGPVPEQKTLPKQTWLLNGSGARPLGSPPLPVLTVEDVAARASAPTQPIPAVTAAQPPAAPAQTPARPDRITKETFYMDGSNNDRTRGAPPQAYLADDVMSGFQSTMKHFLETQERVMLASLGAGGGAAAMRPRRAEPVPRPAVPIAAHPVEAVPAPAPVPVVAPAVPAAPAPAPVQAAAPAPAPVPAAPAAAPVAPPAPAAAAAPDVLNEEGITALLLEITEDRTGYPADMLGMDQGIESDLGIDSIKRLEIVGALVKGLPASQSEVAAPIAETLNQQKTLGAIVETLTAHLAENGGAGGDAAAPAEVQRPFDTAGAENAGEDTRPPRFVPVAEQQPLPSENGTLPEGTYLIVGGSDALARKLEDGVAALGGTPRRIALDAVDTTDGPVAGVIHLAAMDAAPLALDQPETWADALEASEASAARLAGRLAGDLSQGRFLLVSDLGGQFGRDGGPLRLAGGAPGLAKSLREEWPDARPKAVDLDPSEDTEAQAQHILAELAAADGRIEVGYPQGARTLFRTIETPAGGTAMELPDAPVILATGGARGITSECLRPFAAPGATFVLVGRSDLPGEEPADTAALPGSDALFQHLMKAARQADETFTPVQIKNRCAAILRDREIRANLADLEAAGAAVDYRQADLGEVEDVEKLVAAVLTDHGRIDGVIHGAGVIEDRKITDKTPDSWMRVVRPKVFGMLALAKALETQPPQFFAVFASVAGRYGNSGQTDYAAANEVMNRMAHQLDARWSDCRVVAVNWGPWGATTHGEGMVSDAVRSKFEAQGVWLVPAVGGAEAFHDEILRGHDAAVILGAGPWERRERERAGEPLVSPVQTQAPDPVRLPLLAGIVRDTADKGGTRLRRSLTLDSVPWLEDHRIGGAPVLPMAFAAEFAAEAAAEIWPDWQVNGLSDLRVLSGIRLEDDAELNLELIGYGSEHADAEGFNARVEIRSAAKMPRMHYRASVQMCRPGALPQPADQIELAEDILAHRAAPSTLTAYAAYRDILSHGPEFQLVKAIEGLDAAGVTSEVRASLPCSLAASNWLVDPGLLDAAAQLAWVWAASNRGEASLPNSLGRATRLGMDSGSGEDLRMVLRLRPETTAPQVLMDVAISDAEGRPLWLLEGLESTSDKSLRRIMGWSGNILDDVQGAVGHEAAQ